ncbi:hypothetical protein RF11_14245 [Thelohanellus kitauei]|uniref:Uncharacterized protein n=1 Tax=Thelohanellus kitauei TaxID=669202 RepID=A0A0C2IEV4_THEKT|nr:hypothetical protein RF11_14245 [Thelohanellus kitauei]
MESEDAGYFKFLSQYGTVANGCIILGYDQILFESSRFRLSIYYDGLYGLRCYRWVDVNDPHRPLILAILPKSPEFRKLSQQYQRYAVNNGANIVLRKYMKDEMTEIIIESKKTFPVTICVVDRVLELPSVFHKTNGEA